MIDIVKDSSYKIVYYSTVHDANFYMPADVQSYHMNRVINAEGLAVYASSGATKEVLTAIMDQMIALCNDPKPVATLRTDIGTLANNIKYRLQYPVDEDASVRIGASLCFIPGEDPNKVDSLTTERKLAMAKGDPTNNIPYDADLYAFFLSLGIEYMGKSVDVSATTTDTEYFKKRREALRALTPPQ